jgi:hypothetical protein
MIFSASNGAPCLTPASIAFYLSFNIGLRSKIGHHYHHHTRFGEYALVISFLVSAAVSLMDFYRAIRVFSVIAAAKAILSAYLSMALSGSESLRFKVGYSVLLNPFKLFRIKLG